MATIAAVAGLAAAAAAGYGAYSANQNAAAARAQNAMGMDVQRRQMELSREQQAASLAPTTDARGNVTRYIPGVGWVETPTDLTRTIMQRSDREEASRLAEDLPRQRFQREAMFRQQQNDRGLANALLSRTNIGTRGLRDVEADAVRLGAAEINAANARPRSDATIAALRQGTSAQAMTGAMDRTAGPDLRVVLERARAAAPREFADAESARLNDPINRYNTLMQRALAPDNTPFTPSTLADTLSAGRMKQQGTAAYGLAQAGNLRAQQVLPVDEGRAARFAAAAGGLQKFMSNRNTQQDMSDAGDWLQRAYYDMSGFNSGRANTAGGAMYGPPPPPNDPYDPATYGATQGGTGNW